FIIYPFANGITDHRQNEFTGVKQNELFRLNFYDWKKQIDKLVMLAPVTFRNKTDFNAHRLLRAMDHNTLLSKLDAAEQAQPSEIMQPMESVRNDFRDYPFVINNTEQLLEQCEIDFEFHTNKNLKYLT